MVKYFLEKLPDSPGGRLSNHESPDFILRTNRRYGIGIEITRAASRQADDIKSLEDLVKVLNERISKKEEKLKRYSSNRLNAYWLVITIDLLVLRTTANLEDKLKRLVMKGSFDRVWLMDLFGGRIFEISGG